MKHPSFKSCMISLLFTGSCIMGFSLSAQPNMEWQVCLGPFTPKEIQQTKDGGYIIVGQSYSSPGDPEALGGYDIKMVKLNPNGEVEWKRTLLDSTDEIFNSVRQTPDGGYIAVGYIMDDNYDMLVMKFNGEGETEWMKKYGGSQSEAGNSVELTPDNGYIVAGNSSSIDGDVSAQYGASDAWVVKLNPFGLIEWEKSYGGIWNDYATTIDLTADGGYVMGGSFNNYAPLGLGAGSWIMKLASNGEIEWQRVLGGSGIEGFTYVQSRPDGSYLLATSTNSNDGNVSGNHGEGDIWTAHINSDSLITWQKCFGGTADEGVNQIRVLQDNSFILIGVTQSSSDGDVGQNHGQSDIWIIKCTASGELDWQKVIGGSKFDYGNSIDQTSDGGFIVAASVSSDDGDVESCDMGEEYWVFKLSSTTNTHHIPEYADIIICPDPASSYIQYKINKKNSIELIQLMNADGIILRTITDISSGYIDLDGFSSGIYFIRFSGRHSSIIRKFIKLDE